MKSVLVTGSSGFIGKNLTKYLAEKNFNVLQLNRNSNVCNWRDVFENGIPKNIYAVVHLAGKAHDLKGVSNQDEYFKVNRDLTLKLFVEFLNSDAEIFIFLSSVKASADAVAGVLSENHACNPKSSYGLSKYQAECGLLNLMDQYRKDSEKENLKMRKGKKLYIFRPCMIYGPFGKGNLNLLFSFVEKRIPYPLGLYNNQRSYLSIDNLCFVIVETIQNDIAEGIYQLADDATLSTKEVVRLISETIGSKPIIWNVPKIIISAMAKCCDFFRLPFSTSALTKLTESYCISNDKIISAIGKPLPVSLKEGLLSAFNSLEKSRRMKKF